MRRLDGVMDSTDIRRADSGRWLQRGGDDVATEQQQVVFAVGFSVVLRGGSFLLLLFVACFYCESVEFCQMLFCIT